MDTDEHPRPQTTVEDLARLPPVFQKGGTVNAGNASVSTAVGVVTLSGASSGVMDQ